MDQMSTTQFMLTHMLFVQAHTIAKETCGRRGRFVEDKKEKKKEEALLSQRWRR